MLAKKPRRASGAYSLTNVVAPAYSPPVEKPWMSFNTMSKTGAQKPMVS
jgi:hypothetical protein